MKCKVTQGETQVTVTWPECSSHVYPVEPESTVGVTKTGPLLGHSEGCKDAAVGGFLYHLHFMITPGMERLGNKLNMAASEEGEGLSRLIISIE